LNAHASAGGIRPLLDAIASAPLPVDAARHYHGRGGLHPGCEHWALDAYPPAWLLTSFQAVDEATLATVGDALAARWTLLAPGRPLCWIFQSRVAGRAETRLMAGALPEPHTVSEHGSRYRVHLLRGQNHGLFLDMAEGRRWVAAQARAQPGMNDDQARRPAGLKVLNLFAYTCAFSVVALQAGAAQVVNLDMSAAALGIGKHNHSLNGVAGGARFLPHDLFTSWGKVTRGGPYDLVIVDPPSYQKGSFVATKDYPRLMRRLPELLTPGGQVLLCLNAPELGPEFLHDHMQAQAPQLVFRTRLANPPAFADVDPDRALKALVYAAPA
jgi:23S rRNA (cytosine1962-C5)-methyltransferase